MCPAFSSQFHCSLGPSNRAPASTAARAVDTPEIPLILCPMKSIAVLSTVLVMQASLALADSVYDIKVKDIDGKATTLADYKGKVLLIVNVASHCGLTPQYKGLEAAYEKYKDKGLVVLGFPCNQFNGQEPGTNEEIKK